MAQNVDISVEELVEWLQGESWSDFAQSLASYYHAKGSLSVKQEAAARSMRAKVEAKRQAKKAVAEGSALSQPGVYVKGSQVFLVKKSSRGNLYVSKLMLNSSGSNGHWDYIGQSLLHVLSEEDRLDHVKARELGLAFGVCVRCARVLSNPDSVRNGYGEYCANIEGWPYVRGAAADDIDDFAEGLLV